MTEFEAKVFSGLIANQKFRQLSTGDKFTLLSAVEEDSKDISEILPTLCLNGVFTQEQSKAIFEITDVDGAISFMDMAALLVSGTLPKGCPDRRKILAQKAITDSGIAFPTQSKGVSSIQAPPDSLANQNIRIN